MPERIELDKINDEFLNSISRNKNIKKIIGIGSYHHGIKKHPNDLDYFIIVNISFTNKKIFELSRELEKIKDKYRTSDGKNTLINVFLEDSQGNVLNSVDLWFIKYQNESLQECISNRATELEQYRKKWRNGKILFIR